MCFIRCSITLHITYGFYISFWLWFWLYGTLDILSEYLNGPLLLFFSYLYSSQFQLINLIEWAVSHWNHYYSRVSDIISNNVFFSNIIYELVHYSWFDEDEIWREGNFNRCILNLNKVMIYSDPFLHIITLINDLYIYYLLLLYSVLFIVLLLSM